jgi:hypothetical protein
MSNTTPIDYSILAARKISQFRQRMIDDMTVRNFAPNTMLAYLKQVSYFAQHFDHAAIDRYVNGSSMVDQSHLEVQRTRLAVVFAQISRAAHDTGHQGRIEMAGNVIETSA